MAFFVCGGLFGKATANCLRLIEQQGLDWAILRFVCGETRIIHPLSTITPRTRHDTERNGTHHCGSTFLFKQVLVSQASERWFLLCLCLVCVRPHVCFPFFPPFLPSFPPSMTLTLLTCAYLCPFSLVFFCFLLANPTNSAVHFLFHNNKKKKSNTQGESAIFVAGLRALWVLCHAHSNQPVA